MNKYGMYMHIYMHVIWHLQFLYIFLQYLSNQCGLIRDTMLWQEEKIFNILKNYMKLIPLNDSEIMVYI